MCCPGEQNATVVEASTNALSPELLRPITGVRSGGNPHTSYPILRQGSFPSLCLFFSVSPLSASGLFLGPPVVRFSVFPLWGGIRNHSLMVGSQVEPPQPPTLFEIAPDCNPTLRYFPSNVTQRRVVATTQHAADAESKTRDRFNWMRRVNNDEALPCSAASARACPSARRLRRFITETETTWVQNQDMELFPSRCLVTNMPRTLCAEGTPRDDKKRRSKQYTAHRVCLSFLNLL